MQQLKLLSILFLIAIVNGCDNYTGTCLEDGFHCVNGTVIDYTKRCNGVEDCADGSDEFMCERYNFGTFYVDTNTDTNSDSSSSSSSIPHDTSSSSGNQTESGHEFNEEAVVTCATCTCATSTYNVVKSSPWWNTAIAAPMMGTAVKCNSECVTSIDIVFFTNAKNCKGSTCCVKQKKCRVCSKQGACAKTKPSTSCY